MKKKLSLAFAILFAFTLITGSVAFAAPGDKVQEKIDKAQQRLVFLQEIKPLIEEIANNRQQIKSLNSQLKTAHSEAKSHINALKANLSSLTSEQLTKIETLTQELKKCREDLKATSPKMINDRQTIRSERKTRNYDALKAAYENVSSIQKSRITLLNKLIDLNKQIAQI